MRNESYKKSIVFGMFLMLVFAVFVLMQMNVSADYFAGGSGTEDDPYQIANVTHLQNMELHLDAYYVLVNDIDASVTSTWNSDGSGGYYGFDPIGDDLNVFTGSLDGQGYDITGLFVDRPIRYVGLFALIGTGGSISNVSLVNNNVSGTDYHVGGLIGYNSWGTVSNCYATGTASGKSNVGGLIGYNSCGTVSNCYATGTASGTDYHVGGLIGYTSYGTVSNCYATGTASVTGCAGGLIGYNSCGTVSNCYATGNASGTDYHIGGLIGRNYYGMVSNCYATGTACGTGCAGGLIGYNSYGTVSNCYATGTANGTDYHIGGLIGFNIFGTVSNCYATGTASGIFNAGGLIGHNEDGTVSNCFWDIETSGQSTSSGGTGKTTAEMKDVATYTNISTTGLDMPWDFVGDPYDDTGTEDIWDIKSERNDGYPYLSWQITCFLTAHFIFNPTLPTKTAIVQFNDTSVDGDGIIVDWWWDFGDGYFSNLQNPIHCYYADGVYSVSLTVTDNSGVSDTYTTTINVGNITIVYFLDSNGDPISGGVIKYWSGGWQDFGTTNESGMVSKYLLPDTYKFRMIYDGKNVDKTQDIGIDRGVMFITIKVTVKLLESDDDTIEGGEVKYYASGWKTFGSGTTDINGQAAMEMLPGTYHFRVTYGGYIQQKNTVNIVTTPTITFRTILVTVKLLESDNDPISDASVKYYASGWKDFGTTNSSGEAVMEMMPGSYHFRVTYMGYTQQKDNIDIETTPTLTFQTILVTVQLLESDDEPIEGGEVKYYASGWKDFGTTSGGYVSKELLSGSYHFKMTYEGYTQQQSNVDISANPVVEFQTINVEVELRDSNNTLIGVETTLITDYLNDRVIEIDSDCNIIWQMTDLAFPIDAERLSNGNTLITEFGENYNNGRVFEVDKDKNLIWEYDTDLNWPFDAERLDNGNTLIADQKNNRVFEVTSSGVIDRTISTGLTNTSTTSLYWPIDAERLDNGNTLIVDLNNNRVIEVDPNDKVVWETPYIGSLQDAERLPNGNTLITTVNSIVFEYDSTFNTVWQYTGVGYPSDAERLANGNTVITDGWIYSRVSEVNTSGTIVWEPTNLSFNWPFDAERITSNQASGSVKYYASGWKNMGDTSNGVVKKELLPGSYHFRMNYAGYTLQKSNIDITTTPIITYQTGKVHSNSSNVTEYFASGWKTFTQNMELLPATYNFKYNDGTQKQFTIDAGKINYID